MQKLSPNPLHSITGEGIIKVSYSVVRCCYDWLSIIILKKTLMVLWNSGQRRFPLLVELQFLGNAKSTVEIMHTSSLSISYNFTATYAVITGKHLSWKCLHYPFDPIVLLQVTRTSYANSTLPFLALVVFNVYISLWISNITYYTKPYPDHLSFNFMIHLKIKSYKRLRKNPWKQILSV